MGMSEFYGTTDEDESIATILFTGDVEEEILSTLRELGIGFVAYSPFGRDFPTGQWKSP